MVKSVFRAVRKTFLGTLVLGILTMLWVASSAPVNAAEGINERINFQGRLLTQEGAAAPDGYYNIEFKIYQDGDGQTAGNTTGSPAGSLKWTEDWLNSGSHGVKIRNGYFSVELGTINAFASQIDWDQDTLWLSVNIGDTSSCTITTDFATDCSGDGEMLPMKRLSSTPYALNAGMLDGIDSTGFIQNTTTPQSANIAIQSADAGDTAAVLQGAASQTADLLQLQDSNGLVNAAFNAAGNQLTLGRIASSGTVTQGKLVFSDGTTSNYGVTLQTNGAISDNRTIYLPDESGTLCIQSSSNCGFAVSSLTDNTTDALDIQQGTDNYINIDTTDSNENISFGNTNTNPSYNFLGSGALTVSGSSLLNGGVQLSGDGFLQTQSYKDVSDHTGILIPMYIYPSSVYTNTDYNNLIALKKKYHDVPMTVILNNSGGPGGAQDGNFTAAIQRLHGAGFTVIGYVDTNYTAVSQSAVESDIDDWQSFYPDIDGIFMDRMTSADSGGNVAYYAALTAYAHGKSLYPTIGNAGVAVAEAYFTDKTADQIVIHESDSYPAEATLKGDWAGGNASYNYKKRAALVYEQSFDYSQVSMMRNYLGLIYVTPDTAANPWDTVSTDLESLARALVTDPDVIQNTVNVQSSLYSSNLDTETAGTLTIGGTNATTVNIANNNADHTVNIATGTGTQAVTIGSKSTNSWLKLQGGDYGMAFTVNSNYANSGYNFLIDDTTSIFSMNAQGKVTFRPTTNNTMTFEVQDQDGNEILSTNSLTGVTHAAGLLVDVNGFTSYSSLLIDTTNPIDFTTPQGSDVPTKISIPLYDPGVYGQVIAMGLPSGANSTSRVISLFDNRSAGDNQTPLAVFSPDESQVFGLGWDGQNTIGYLKTTGTTGIGIKINGTVAADFNATLANLNVDTTLAAGKSLTINGGNTASRPGSPTEGMVYYDTTTDQLLTYANGKWQADSKNASFIVAASNSSQADKDGAQYVADGENSSGSGTGTIDGDQIQINNALTAASTAGGGTVYLAPGTYTIDASISVPNGVTLAGAGSTTIVQLGNFGATSTSISMIVNSDTTTGTNITVRDLKLDGRTDRNSAGTQRGLSLNNMGDGSGNSASTRTGGIFTNLELTRILNEAVYAYSSGNSRFSNLNIHDNSYYGILLSATHRSSITSSQFNYNSNTGIRLNAAGNNTITGNTVQNSGGSGIVLISNSYDNTVTGNTAYSSASSGIAISGSMRNTVSGNTTSYNDLRGIYILSSSYSNTITGNHIYGEGSASQNEGIYVNASDYNNITANVIGDDSCGPNPTGTCYAIDIASGTKNYLADNTFVGDGTHTASINDTGTDTVYANQATGENGAKLVNRTANDAAAFTIQKSAGADTILTADTSNNRLKVGNDTESAGSDITLLVLDTAADTYTPTGVAGAMYYDSTNEKFMCYTTSWVDCDTTGGGAATLQDAYDGGNTIVLASNNAVQIQDNSTPITGNLFEVTSNGGSTNFLSVSTSTTNVGTNLVVATGKTLRITGDVTGNRPAATTAGQFYYDTTTNEMLVSNGTKWVSDRSTATVILAANDSPQQVKDAANYVVDGTSDETEINAALSAAAGGTVYLAEGTYVADGTILVPNNTTLAGAGRGTVVKLDVGSGTDNLIEATGSDRTGQIVRDLSLDGSAGTGGTQHGIYFTTVGQGSGTGVSARQGGKIINVFAYDFQGRGIALNGSDNNTISGNVSEDNTTTGIFLFDSLNNTITGNHTQGNFYGIYLNSSSLNTISSNTSEGNTSQGIILVNSSDGNTISSNTVSGTGTDSGENIYIEDSANNTVTGNTVSGSTNSAGIWLYTATYTTVTGNNVSGNVYAGIVLSNSSNNNLISSNKLHDNGGATTNNGIYLSASDANTITNNDITDTSATTNNYAINIFDNTSDNNYLADNRFSSTPGTATINDADTGTVYANQATGENGTKLTNRTANDPAAFTVQNASGTSLLTVDTSSTKVLVGGAIDTTTATTLSIGTSTATAVTIGQAGVTTTNAGALTVSQLLTGNLGATISGATTSINASSNFATNINTGTSTGAVSIGNSAAGAITLQSASTIGLTGTTTITGLTTGNALTVNNSTSTGNIFVAQDNGTAVVTVANGGAVTFRNQTDSASGFAIQDKDGNSRLVVDTSSDRIDVSGAYLRVTGTTTSSVALQLNQSNFTIRSSASTSQYAIQNQAKFDLLNTGSSLGALYGMMNVPTITTTAATPTTIAAVYGEYLRIDKTSSLASITSQFGLRVDDGNDVNVTNKYGVYIDEATSATATNLFSLYVDGSSSSYFGVHGDGLVDSRSNSTTGFQILNSSTSGVVLNVDTANTRLGIGTSAPSTSLAFGAGADRTIGIEARSSNAAGRALTISAGAAGSGASAYSGGTLTLQGGAAAGTGNANGGNVVLTGGTGVGTGVQGLVIVDTQAFYTTTNTACSSDCDISQANVDAYGAVIVEATDTGLTISLPNPTIQTAGRIVYVTAANGSEDFTLSVNGGGQGNEIAMRENTTATMIWNGSDWTAAGASSSTTLQAAYDNTLTAAGGAEIVLNNTASSNGLTVRNNASNPISGAIFEAQTSIGSNLFSVNNNATEYATNGGAETAGASSSTFPASTWGAAPGGGTVSRYTTAGDYVTTGQASVSVVTGATANHGAANQLANALTANLKYRVSYAIRGTTNFSTLDTHYSVDGSAANVIPCGDTDRTVTQGLWTRITCTFVADPTVGTIDANNAIFIRQSDATARTFYVENLSVTVSADVNHAVDGDVDDPGDFTTNYTAAAAGGTVSRSLSTLYNTSGSAQVITAATANQGLVNNMNIQPQTSTQYLVSFYALTDTAFSDITVQYSRNGGTNTVPCTDYNTQTVSTSTWTKITCVFTTDGTTATNADLIITQASATARTFWVDAINITLNTNTASNVQVGGGNYGGPTTLLTLDRSDGPPIAANNPDYYGSMYYDTTTGRIQCYEADGWGACGSPPDNYVNLNPEYAGAVLNGDGIGTMNADLCANESGVLSVNSSLCASGESKNYYNWTSPQASQQTYSVYVSYQLPTTFKGFSSDDTVQLTARVDNTSNAAVTYEMFRSENGSLERCGTGETTVTTSADTWQTVGINGNEATSCGFTPQSAEAYVIFKINMKSNSNANAYVSTLSFVTSGQ